MERKKLDELIKTHREEGRVKLDALYEVKEDLKEKYTKQEYIDKITEERFVCDNRSE